MITAQQVAEKLESMLNANSYGVKFGVHTPVDYEFKREKLEAGLQQAYKSSTIFCVIDNYDTKYSPINGLHTESGVFSLRIMTRKCRVGFEVNGKTVFADEKDYVAEKLDAIFQNAFVGKIVELAGEKALFYPSQVAMVPRGAFCGADTVELVAQFAINVSSGIFYGAETSYYTYLVAEDGTRTEIPLKPVSRGNIKTFSPSAFQNINEVTALSVNTQNSSTLSLSLLMMDDAFHRQLAEDILKDTFQNKIYTIGKRLKSGTETVYDVEYDYIMTSGSLDDNPTDFIRMDCVFARALEQEDGDV